MQAIESKAPPSPPEPTMRQERTVQATIFEVFAGHEIGCELKAISHWLVAVARPSLDRMGRRHASAVAVKQRCRAGQVGEHRVGSAKRPLGVDDPCDRTSPGKENGN